MIAGPSTGPRDHLHTSKRGLTVVRVAFLAAGESPRAGPAARGASCGALAGAASVDGSVCRRHTIKNKTENWTFAPGFRARKSGRRMLDFTYYTKYFFKFREK